MNEKLNVLSKIDKDKLSDIVDDLFMIKTTIDWEGYDPDRISQASAIRILSEKLIELVEIVQCMLNQEESS